MSRTNIWKHRPGGFDNHITLSSSEDGLNEAGHLT